MTRTIEDTGDGVMTKALFVRGVDSAQIALSYALKLGVADADWLEMALDARGAFDLLSEMLTSFGTDQFQGDALAATRDDIHQVMTALCSKHPSVAPVGDSKPTT